MTDHMPGTVGEAFANLAAGFERLGRSVRQATRYVAADMHRKRLINSGKYIKTSSRKARP